MSFHVNFLTATDKTSSHVDCLYTKGLLSCLIRGFVCAKVKICSGDCKWERDDDRCAMKTESVKFCVGSHVDLLMFWFVHFPFFIHKFRRNVPVNSLLTYIFN